MFQEQIARLRDRETGTEQGTHLAQGPSQVEASGTVGPDATVGPDMTAGNVELSARERERERA
eukprot:9928551-Alexandrium_andersonii.AAC.1